MRKSIPSLLTLGLLLSANITHGAGVDYGVTSAPNFVGLSPNIFLGDDAFLLLSRGFTTSFILEQDTTAPMSLWWAPANNFGDPGDEMSLECSNLGSSTPLLSVSSESLAPGSTRALFTGQADGNFTVEFTDGASLSVSQSFTVTAASAVCRVSTVERGSGNTTDIEPTVPMYVRH